MSHLVDQPLINRLPALILVNWALAFCASKTSAAVDLRGLTLVVLEHLFSSLSVSYGVDFCGFLVCRRCLARFKLARLRGVDEALHRYLTNILHKVANEGDNNICHQSTPNSTLKSKLRIPTEDQVSVAIASRGICPFLLPSISAPKAEAPRLAPSESRLASSESGLASSESHSGGRTLRSREYSERKESRWEDGSVDQVVELRREDLGARNVSQRLPSPPQGVPSPPAFWKPFVPSTSSTVQPSSPDPAPSPISAKTTTPYSDRSQRSRSHNPRSLSPSPNSRNSRSRSPVSHWTDCSVSSPSLFDDRLLDDDHDSIQLSPSAVGRGRSPF